MLIQLVLFTVWHNDLLYSSNIKCLSRLWSHHFDHYALMFDYRNRNLALEEPHTSRKGQKDWTWQTAGDFSEERQEKGKSGCFLLLAARCRQRPHYHCFTPKPIRFPSYRYHGSDSQRSIWPKIVQSAWHKYFNRLTQIFMDQRAKRIRIIHSFS